MKNYKQKVIEPTNHNRDFTPPPVTKYMVPRRDLITFQPDTEISDVVKTLLKHKITGAPVLDAKGALLGLIDDKDCIKVLMDAVYYNNMQRMTVANYTTNVMKTISDKANVVEVANEFSRTIYKRLLVVNKEGELVGQISRQDILQAISDYSKNIF
ncbi:MAG TPA: CBS domain-containing protein [Saprospiraceae bacterium]|nr:CBS domain-containing protein [Saprospiraceae bacterium]